MAGFETPLDPTVEQGGDVDMAGAEEIGENSEMNDLSMLPETELEIPKRETFLDYLRSPIIELAVGSGDQQTILHAHKAMLIKSPYFAAKCEEFADNATSRRISLPDDDLDATGSVLEYLYNAEYFPKRLEHTKDQLEPDPSIPQPDTSGTALLKHARVYTLADKFGLPSLKSLAHAKIHRTQSTAKGEIAYARYVYAKTSAEDTIIRRPVAAFWATRSHVLRHEAEDEFRAMCLEYPQFGFDVLNLVLDQKEKRKEESGSHGHVQVHAGERSGRKRARMSSG